MRRHTWSSGHSKLSKEEMTLLFQSVPPLTRSPSYASPIHGFVRPGFWGDGQKGGRSSQCEVYHPSLLCITSESTVLAHFQEGLGLQSQPMGAIRDDVHLVHL